MERYSVSFLVEITYTSSDAYLINYFVQVSGENLELARAEIEALVKLYPVNIRITWLGRIAKLKSAVNPTGFLLERAAHVQRAGILIGEFIHEESIIDDISDECWKDNVFSSDKFSVRTMCIESVYDHQKRIEIEKKLGAHIRNVTRAKVELKSPDTHILVIIVAGRFLVCKSIESKLRRLLRAREPGKKPFFHPSMMNSTLARTMCNLAGVRPGNTVLDPFCGGGGILCEASYIGALVIGIDKNWTLLEGARVNLSGINSKYSIIQADALYLPVQTVDHIVTDPPYGRSSSTRGAESRELFDSLLRKAPSILQPGGENLCICASSEMELSEMIRNAGLSIGYKINIIVHSGLIREVVTVKL
ncbi:MAG: THUMP domain-containing protein [Candidatus Thorarchaeota archaeon]|nr:THUMP domain-containing protein [Candidatus Thorarchaeota archaeon]